MFYPKADCCPFNADENCASAHKDGLKQREADLFNNNMENDNHNYSKCEMARQIQEIDFAIIDLNLFLDTHPNCKEALELFTELCATSKSLKNDYQAKYGPLYATKSSRNTPFEWVGACYKWPWEK